MLTLGIYKRENKTILLKQATLCYLVRGTQILLAMKKRGFGKGKWNGIGGKPHEGETIENTAIRETQEEIGATPKDLVKVAILDFYFAHKTGADQQVCAYISQVWDGTPVETEEMSPKWYEQDRLPFDFMWLGDKYWLPLVLQGKKIKAEFLFGEGDVLLDYEMTEIHNLC